MAHFRGTGKIIVGKNVLIGPACFISASTPNKTLTIGEGSVLAAGTVLINKDVPPHTMMGGVPAKPIAKVTNPLTLDTSYEEFKKGIVPLDK
jgi:acetyltransferase-like isoleucine patch superfamily enzyme